MSRLQMSGGLPPPPHAFIFFFAQTELKLSLLLSLTMVSLNSPSTDPPYTLYALRFYLVRNFSKHAVCDFEEFRTSTLKNGIMNSNNLAIPYLTNMNAVISTCHPVIPTERLRIFSSYVILFPKRNILPN